MKISALTTCVGDKYAQALSKALGIWEETCNELLVLTDWKTYQDNRAVFPTRITYVTEIFTAHGASFNKGAALSQGFGLLNPDDWVLNFDADIVPPATWREHVEAVYKVELLNGQSYKLYGCSHRYGEDGALIPDADFPNIWGFFHLWNIADLHSWKRPPFDPTCGHAGNYDHEFMMQWPEDCRVDLWPELKLTHQGEPRESWFGRDPKNKRKMENLFRLGLWDAWQFRVGHFTPTDQPIKIEIDGSRSPAAIVKTLRFYTDPDPFKYQVTVNKNHAKV